MRMAAVALLLLLAACGGGSDQPAAKPTAPATQPATTAPPALPTTAPTTGTPAPEALSRFRCEKNKKGDWNAAGFLANDGKVPLTFQVTVYIGPATGGQERARTRQVSNVGAGGSVSFTIKKIPAPDDDGPCRVQVLASK